MVPRGEKGVCWRYRCAGSRSSSRPAPPSPTRGLRPCLSDRHHHRRRRRHRVPMTFVIPRFATIFEDPGQASRSPRRSSSQRARHAELLVGGVLLVRRACSRGATGRATRTVACSGINGAAPAAGGATVHEVETARFARTLGTMLKSGCRARRSRGGGDRMSTRRGAPCRAWLTASARRHHRSGCRAGNVSRAGDAHGSCGRGTGR